MLLPVCLRYGIVVSVLQLPIDTPSALVQAVSFACDLFWRTSCTLQNNHRAAPRSQICFCHLLLLTYILCIEKGREKTWDFLSPSDIRSERELHFNSFHSLILENLFHSISFSFRLWGRCLQVIWGIKEHKYLNYLHQIDLPFLQLSKLVWCIVEILIRFIKLLFG